eukprot:347886-Chlamydomonas_euryale.AAC.2
MSLSRGPAGRNRPGRRTARREAACFRSVAVAVPQAVGRHAPRRVGVPLQEDLVAPVSKGALCLHFPQDEYVQRVKRKVKR